MFDNLQWYTYYFISDIRSFLLKKLFYMYNEMIYVITLDMY